VLPKRSQAFVLSVPYCQLITLAVLPRSVLAVPAYVVAAKSSRYQMHWTGK
jgi:hypothetical protein